MNVLLLVIALATPVDAPKTDLPAVAAADAAAAAVTVVGEVAPPSAAVLDVTVVGEVAPTSAAVLDVAVVGEVAPMAAAVCAETVVGEIAPMSAAVLPEGGVLPAAASAAGCALVDLFKGDAGFLTGPWGAAWRLEAARKRGDEEAVRRLEMMLDALLGEAVGDGE